MGDYHVMMQFEVAADSVDVMRRLKSTEAIASWWSDGVSGSAGSVGDRFKVTLPDAPAAFELEVTRADGAGVDWFVAAQPEWWAGTTVRIDVVKAPGDEGSMLHFSHRDFDADSPVIAMVTPAWAQIVARLKAVAESGHSDPFFVNGEPG